MDLWRLRVAQALRDAVLSGRYAKTLEGIVRVWSSRNLCSRLGDHAGIDEIACQFALLECRRLTRFQRLAPRNGKIEAGTFFEEDIFPGRASLVENASTSAPSTSPLPRYIDL